MGRLRGLAVVALTLLFAAQVEGIGRVAARQEGGAAKAPTVNIELVLDSSGSMAEATDAGEAKMDAAKAALHEVIDAIPTKGAVNVGFRIYGHKGDNSDAAKPVSCQASDLQVLVKGVNRDALLGAIDGAQPTGWTPIGRSLELAGKDFPAGGKGVINTVVLVTDGTETCDADPCRVAADIHDGPGKVVTDVVGFGTTPDDQQTLGCIAKNGGGELLAAGNAQQLRSALFSVLEQLQVVVGAGYVGGNAFSLLPQGEPGKLSVIAHGPVDDLTHQLPVVIRNNTGRDVVGPKVSVTVRDGAGGLLGAGDAQSMAPFYVRAGGVAFGAIAFLNAAAFPQDATYEFKVKPTPPSEARFYPQADLDIVEAAGFEDHVAGTVKNGYDKSVKGPLMFAAVCLDENGNVLNYNPGFGNVGQLAPGETQSFQVDLPAATLSGVACPAYLVVGHGFGTPRLPKAVPAASTGPHPSRSSTAVPTPKPTRSALTAQPTVAAAPGAATTNTGVSVEMRDISFAPKDLTVPAGVPVTVTLTNTGAIPHNFSIDELGVSVDVAPGETQEATISAPAGTYQFYCNVPGHTEAGMVGTLTAQ